MEIWVRPARNHALSATMDAATAPTTNAMGEMSPAAARAPPNTRAGKAGTGSPSSSARTAPKIASSR
jgi:hypothetical protein